MQGTRTMSYKDYYKSFQNDVREYYGERKKNEPNMTGLTLDGFNVIEVDIDSFGNGGQSAKQMSMFDDDKTELKR